MPLPHHSDFPGVRLNGPRILDGVTTAQPRAGLPEFHPYAYNGDGTTTADLPLTPTPRTHGCAWPSLCLHDTPPDIEDAPVSAPAEWHHELTLEAS